MGIGDKIFFTRGRIPEIKMSRTKKEKRSYVWKNGSRQGKGLRNVF